jgi:hypothetical protein
MCPRGHQQDNRTVRWDTADISGCRGGHIDMSRGTNRLPRGRLDPQICAVIRRSSLLGRGVQWLSS